MKQHQTILVAIDELDRTNVAVDAGLAISDALHAPLELVHSMGLPTDAELDAHSALQLATLRGELIERRRASIEARLQPFFTAYGRNAGAQLHVRLGKASMEVLDQAKESKARLLVLGPHQRAGVLDWGSTARALLAASPCNVWTQPTPWRPVKRILVPLDLSDHSIASLRVAIQLALELGAELTCMHAWYPAEVFAGIMGDYPMSQSGISIEEGRKAAEQALHESLENVDFRGVPWRAEFCEDRAVEAILERQSDVDLIAMGSHGRTGLALAILGNTAYSVLTKAACPVLAIRRPEEG